MPLTTVLPADLIEFLVDEGRLSWTEQLQRLEAEHRECRELLKALKNHELERSPETIENLALRLTSLKRQAEDFIRRMRQTRNELREIDQAFFNGTFFRRGLPGENPYLIRRAEEAARMTIAPETMQSIDEDRMFLAHLKHYVEEYGTSREPKRRRDKE